MNAAPYKAEENDLNKRKLPFDGSLYPSLTISDFLENVLVRVPHMLNSQYYFDGNLVADNTYSSYLLPLSTRFFDYFTIEDLIGEMPDGKKMFEMELIAGGSVKVNLRIPIVVIIGLIILNTQEFIITAEKLMLPII